METSAVFLLQQCLATQEAADHVIYQLSEERIHEAQGNTDITKASAWLQRNGDRLKYAAAYTNDKGKVTHFVEIITRDMRVRYQWEPPQKGASLGHVDKELRLQAFVERCGALDGYDPTIRPLKRLASFLQAYPDTRVSREEAIGETSCKVLSATTPYGEFTLWLAESMGCLPLKMTHKANPKDISGYNDVNKTYQETYKDFLSCELTVENMVIQKIGGVFFPVNGKKTSIFRYTNMEMKDTFNIIRDKVQINPSFKDDDFSIDLPEGARVLDNDYSGVMYEFRGGTVVPAQSDFTAQAESHWPDRHPWLLITGWIVSGLGLLAVALRVIWNYKKRGEAV